MRNLNTSYNPTFGGTVLEDLNDHAFVGGTDDNYENPISFQEAWHHPDPIDRKKWREAIRKEFRDMITKGVWRQMKTNHVPVDRRLIGSKWAFRLLMVVALFNGRECEIVDVETAFLYGELEEDIFMKIPQGLNDYLEEDNEELYGDDDCFI